MRMLPAGSIADANRAMTDSIADSSGRHRRLRYGEFPLGEYAEILEQLPVLDSERPRLLIKNTKRASLEPIYFQGAAGVKTDIRIADNHRIVGESLVFESVLHVEDVVKENRVRAKRNIP